MRVLAKLRTIKLKSIIFIALLIAVYIIIMSIFLEVWFIKINSNSLCRPVVLPYVVVHLDLKGTPLKLSYLKSLLPALKANGANSILMEYEDMFPYEGRLVNLSAENCYQKSELKKFLTLAKDSGFEIIPLVQTFGHMEHVLKLAEFQHLREVSQHPDSICPSHPETMVLLEEMLQQVIQFHDSISPLKFIHIGCDEVYNINKCSHCVKRNITRMDIFLRHVKTLSDIAKSLNSEMTLLIWDDMLRGIKPNLWKNIDYFDNVQPVYWDYRSTIEVMHTDFLMYHNKFKHIWIASAFKGADGRDATFPLINNRFLNLLNWMSFIQEYRFGGEAGVYNFKGVILTGWSRYSHMDPPCELLPVSYPSLIISLLLVQKFKTGEFCATRDRSVHRLEAFVDTHLTKDIMQCSRTSHIFNESQCKFDGLHLHNALAKYSNFDKALFKEMDELGARYFEYYSRIGTLNTNKVLNYITTLTLSAKIRTELESVITKEMKKYYEKDFVAEYINHKTYYDKKLLQNTLMDLSTYLNVKIWPRRTKNSSYFVQDFSRFKLFNKTIDVNF